MEGPLKGLFTTQHRQLSDSLSTEAIELIPFDITLALTGSQPVDIVTLTDAVTDWLNENFEESAASVDYRYKFRRVVLRTLNAETSSGSNSNNRRDLQSAYKVTYDGMSYWTNDREVPSETTVAAIQLDALVTRDELLAKLRAESDDRGLGAAVVDARGDLNRNAQLPPSSNSNSSSGDNSLNVIIVVAIVIAVLASLLLIFAVFMAWRTGTQRKERTYHDGTRQTSSDPSHAANQNEQPLDNMDMDNSAVGPYADSVITDDISSSLSAYYKSGMAGGYKANRSQHGALNDAASVSSMESYGYSLDGYASSIAN